MHDVVVVGARCAGAVTGMLLARAGHRVLLLDRATFPSDTLSTAFIWPRGGAKLADWGLWDRLLATGCPPFARVTNDDAVRFTGEPPPVGTVSEIVVPRRTVLDQLLIDAAVDAGCELLQRFDVTGLLREQGQVVGVTGREVGGAGAERAFRASFVVGADGMRSRVAAQVGARVYGEYPNYNVGFYTYVDDHDVQHAVFSHRPGQSVLAFPTHDGEALVYVSWPLQTFDDKRRNLAGAFWTAVDRSPVGELVAREAADGRLRGTTDLRNFYREACGPGWLLVGDAGHHKDPLTGMGISDAFAQAELAARAISGALGGETAQEALGAYTRGRDALGDHVYRWTLLSARILASGQAAPVPREVRQAVHDPEMARRVLGVLSGVTPYWEVLSAGDA